MIESNCLYCGKTTKSPYIWAFDYCSDSNCKVMHKAAITKSAGAVTCLKCGHAWIPRNIIGKPPCCPSCKARDYGSEFVELKQVKRLICHKCGGLKREDKVVCPCCGQPNTNITHYCGVPKKYFEAFMKFVENYSSDEVEVLELKNRLYGPLNEELRYDKDSEGEKSSGKDDIQKPKLSRSEPALKEEVLAPTLEEEKPLASDIEVVLEEKEVLTIFDELDWGEDVPESTGKKEK